MLTSAMRALVEAGGPFVGERRPCTRVTVQPDFWLRETTPQEMVGYAQAGESVAKMPYRWYQHYANEQVEVEIPSVTQVDINRSLDNDADSCTITLANQLLDPVGQDLVEGIFGDPGAFTPDRANAESQARWGTVPNDWAGLLDVNSLIRTYWGYGGHDKTIEEAVADGDLLLKGVWLVDSVTPSPKSNTLTLACRDMFKLLIDQQIYPPLVPDGQYPMRRARYKYNTEVRPPIHEYHTDNLGPERAGPGAPEPQYVGADGWGKWVPDFAVASHGKGYWILGSDGAPFAHGEVGYYGSMGSGGLDSPAQSIAAHPSNEGYWFVTERGRVYSFGAAQDYGSYPFASTGLMRRIVATPSGEGYYLLNRRGAVFTFGDAQFRGGMTSGDDLIVGMVLTASGKGYWLLSERGRVYSFGDAARFPPLYGPAWAFDPETGDVRVPHEVYSQVPPPYGHLYEGMAPLPDGSGFWTITDRGHVGAVGNANLKQPNVPFVSDDEGVLPDRMYNIVPTPTGFGYWVISGDGRLYASGDAGYYGSLPDGGSYTHKQTGDYVDLVEIVKDLLLWSGFWLKGAGPHDVYGNLEQTGTDVKEVLSADYFDKRNVIDVITQIRQVVGYFAWCDEEGAARLESPNFWEFGNFMPDGSRTEDLPVIDEVANLIDWNPTRNDTARSQIIVASSEPTAGLAGTVTTRYIAPAVTSLKGLQRPLTLYNGLLTKKAEQELMAEIIAMQQFFKTHAGTATVVAHPGLEINDQVWIYERSTGEARVHFIRGIQTSHNLATGQLTMTLNTHRLGTRDDWYLAWDPGGEPGLVGLWLANAAVSQDGIGTLWDLSNNGNHARLGGPEPGDPSEPKVLMPTKEGPFVYLPGGDGNGVSSMWQAGDVITGDLDLRWHGQLDTWTPERDSALISRMSPETNQRSFGFEIVEGTGHLRLSFSFDGLLTERYASNVPPDYVPGQPIWLRCIRVVSTGVVSFYTSTDGETWEMLGIPLDSGIPGPPFQAEGIPIMLGARSDWLRPELNVKGRVYAAEVRDGIDGRVVATFNAAAFTEPHLYAWHGGRAWTIHRAETGPRSVVVDRPLLLFGPDDYLTIPDDPTLNFDEDDGFFFFVAFRRHDHLFSHLLDKRGATGAGYSLRHDTDQPTHMFATIHGEATPGNPAGVTHSTDRTYAQSASQGHTQVFGLWRRVTAQGPHQIALIKNNFLTQSTTVEPMSLSNAQPLTIGRRPGVGADNPREGMEFLGAAMYRLPARVSDYQVLLRAAYDSFMEQL